MAAIVHQKDKRSGITYAYESVSYWDKEKKQSRAKRTLIGRVDETSGEIVQTDGRGRKKKRPDISAVPATRKFYGATYLFDAIGKKLGLVDDLKVCFGNQYNQILSLAYYLMLEENSPLYRFEKWSCLHQHPYGEDIPSQRSSELFGSIDESRKQKFFSLQAKRREKEEYWAYDTTSISSYSEQLKQVQYGYNKEHDPLAQINLALVFGEKSNLPFYYRKLSGNIPDSKTLKHLLDDFDTLGFSKAKLVMDRGFYSKDNVNALYKGHRKFILSAKNSLSFVKKGLEPLYDTFRSFEHYNEQYALYSHTVQTTWEYEQVRPYKGDTLQSDKRIYIHYYYNIERAAEEETAFDKRLIGLRNELISQKRIASHEALYRKYFTIKQTPKRGVSAEVKEEVVNAMKRYYGFFVLISNETMNSIEALEIYRNKDVVEKAFGNLKERLNMRRMLVSSERNLEGKLFVEFIALIYLSYIKKQMQTQEMYKQYTLGSMLDKLDVIECYQSTGHKLRVGEVLEKQKEIYRLLGVDVPSSL